MISPPSSVFFPPQDTSPSKAIEQKSILLSIFRIFLVIVGPKGISTSAKITKKARSCYLCLFEFRKCGNRIF